MKKNTASLVAIWAIGIGVWIIDILMIAYFDVKIAGLTKFVLFMTLPILALITAFEKMRREPRAIANIWLAWGIFWFLGASALTYSSKSPWQLISSIGLDTMMGLMILFFICFPLLRIALLVTHLFLVPKKRFNIILDIIWTTGIGIWLAHSPFLLLIHGEAPRYIGYILVWTIPTLIGITIALRLIRATYKRTNKA